MNAEGCPVVGCNPLHNGLVLWLECLFGSTMANPHSSIMSLKRWGSLLTSAKETETWRTRLSSRNGVTHKKEKWCYYFSITISWNTKKVFSQMFLLLNHTFLFANESLPCSSQASWFFLVLYRTLFCLARTAHLVHFIQPRRVTWDWSRLRSQSQGGFFWNIS